MRGSPQPGARVGGLPAAAWLPIAILSAAPLASALAAPGPAAPAAPAPARSAAAGDPNRLVRDGVVVDFSITRPGEAPPGLPLQEGDFAEVRFRMTDATTGRPVAGLNPAAWLDMATVVAGKGGAERECKEKIGLYLKGVVGVRPLVDLNAYYLLLLNDDASISVVDPVVNMTGNTSLFASVPLKRPGADWTRDREERRLFVSMPRAGEVAVIDVETFKVVGGVQAGQAPTRLALQPDGQRLWVGNDADAPGQGGVTVIDTATLQVARRIATGRGHHEIGFSADGRLAFVTNRADGTVAVIDTGRLVKVKELKVGGVPISVATSPLSRFVYVAEARGGAVLAIDPARLEVAARLQASPGLGPMRFSLDGRWGFVVNPAEQALHVLDAAANRLVHTIPMGGKPYQVTVTRAFAYVRLLDKEQVKLVNLLSLGEGKQPIVQAFGAGTGAPMAAGELSLADAITPAASDSAVFALNPADGNTYFYMEGMNAASGSFGGYGHRVQAVGVVDRSLREVEPGVYAGKLRLPAAGRYDVAFLLESPRVLHCFSADALPDPALAHEDGLDVEFLDLPPSLAAGAAVPVRLRLVGARDRRPRSGLGDVFLSSHLVPGRHRRQQVAREVGDGVYQVTVPLLEQGVHYLFVSVPSLRLGPDAIPYRAVQVQKGAPPVPRTAKEVARDADR
ncbi:MAG: cytochrome D1 [Anaeromyxobacteraceae bacterium]|nr:cytochrome D1 [Anaeromyxobacteraceae bacterium]